ncbi:ATPase component of ABC transporters with duplicated ATPase domain [Halobacteroides halobius DSM 5150]|uniref:ATPase component of ABC transporters with duplicated ATPase domain n=1 Tax=Halobacteroides halobius (strain ATCC 35273 / DSM 5150 / MD-1) TaxID=748449 RepID=L0K7B3_HALHC|nr:ABC-F family ATP-binding cassette domain-containing protein [Halobacteroides halobius]AGB40425.1 ATPase component of ABC transporters with duplicated ATPase domain [Halobacteroides halobius DSM 5150]
MSLLQLRKGSKRYPEQIIFQDISLQIQKQDRVGLIGANGTGKSTLVKILRGQEYLDKGEILTSNDLEMGYLAQDFGLKLDKTLYEEMLSVFSDLFALEEKIKGLETKMGQLTGDQLEKVMNRYSRLRQNYEDQNGYQVESQIKGILRGLGFSKADFNEQLINFSGGQKTRAALAKLLLQQPDLLLLDEPTNHLDLAAKEWLEDYLNDYPGAIVIISHDRYFLDKVVNRIWELEKGRFEKYKGDYSFYLEEKKHRLLTWQREYEQQQEKIKELKAYIRKNKAGVDAKQARGRQKKLDRMKEIAPPPSLEKPKIEFEMETTSGAEVLDIKGLTKSYQQEKVLEGIDFKLYRGEKVALVGPNGSGKSTLFKLLLGQENAEAGTVNLGARVKIGYYDQEHESLNPEYNLIEELKKVKKINDSQARDILARFLFKGDEVFKKVATLSGGEQARLSLAKLSIQDFNLLLLDEPTNHLDIKSKEILETALDNYPGTILVISHDRYFLDKLISKVFALENNDLVEYAGDYSDYYQQYQESLAQQKEEKKGKPKQEVEQNKPKDQQINLEELESEIMKLEAKVEELEEEFNQQDLYDDQEEVAELTKKYERLKEELNDYYSLWEEAI